LSEDALVRKPNSIIQAGQDLTAIQQNVFYVMLRRFAYISGTTNDHAKLASVVYEIPYSDLVHNYDKKKGGELVERVRSQVEKLAKQVLTVKEGKTEKFIALFGETSVTEGSTVAKVEFNIKAVPYIVDMIRDGYTKLIFKDVFALRSAYAKRIYELASLHRSDPKVKKDGYYKISVEDFRFKLGITEKMYPRWVDMRIRVIDPAVEEILEKTSVRFVLDYEKAGRKITHLIFRELVLIEPIYNPDGTESNSGFEQVVLDLDTVKQVSIFDTVEKESNPLLDGLMQKDREKFESNHSKEYIAHYHKKVKALESKGRLKSDFASCLFTFLTNDADDFYNRPKKTVAPKQPSSEIERRLADRKKVEQESARMKDLEKLFVSLPVDIQQERIFAIKETMPLFSEEMARKQAILEFAKVVVL